MIDQTYFKPGEYLALLGPWKRTPWYLRLCGKPAMRRLVTFYLGKQATHACYDWSNDYA